MKSQTSILIFLYILKSQESFRTVLNLDSSILRLLFNGVKRLPNNELRSW